MTQITNNDLPLLRIGTVSAVRASGVEIAVDADKNEPSILYKGDIIDNVTIGSHVIIHRGYRKLVAHIEEEYPTEDRQWRDDEYHRDADHYKRTLRATLQGELIDNSFERGRAIMPMIGNIAYIATKQQVGDVYGTGDPPSNGPTKRPMPPTLEIGSLNSDPSVRFKLSIGKFFASHIGIFGNTGSGKSYTLTQLYTKLFAELLSPFDQSKAQASDSAGVRKTSFTHTQFLIFDLNGEYSSPSGGEVFCPSSFKEVLTLKPSKHSNDQNEGDSKIPLPEHTLTEPDFWYTLLEATEKTQRPFIARALRDFTIPISPSATPYWLQRDTFKHRLLQLLTATKSGDVDTTLIFQYLNDIHSIADGTHTAFEEAFARFESNFSIFSPSGDCYFRDSCFNVSRAITKPNDTRIFVNDDNFHLLIDNFFNQAYSPYIGSRLDPLSLTQLKIVCQFYDDISCGFHIVAHLRPLIGRLRQRTSLLARAFQFERSVDLRRPAMRIINLRYCSIEERKLIPLLVTRAAYKTQKDNFHSDRYLNIIIDEAHNLLSYESSQESETWRNTRLEMFEEVLKEGRKFGVFVTLASQRPHDISATITSQLHHYLLHQLVNPKDIDAVRRAVSYLDAKSFDELSSLPRGTCIISGTSVQIPAIVKIDELPEGRRPDNETIDLVKLWGLGSDSAVKNDSDSSVSTSTRAESAADADSTRAFDT